MQIAEYKINAEGLAYVADEISLHTTIRCSDENCCGCLDAVLALTNRPKPHIDGKHLLIFVCNECGEEQGRAETSAWLY
jgi:hypothetical protein